MANQVSDEVRASAIEQFESTVENLKLGEQADFEIYLQAVRDLGAALGQETLYNNFVDQLAERQQFLRELPETAAKNALEIFQKVEQYEVDLQNQNRSEAITREGRVQEGLFGRLTDLETKIQDAVSGGLSAIGSLAGIVQGALEMLGMSEWANRVQSGIDSLISRGQSLVDGVRRIDRRVDAAEDVDTYDPTLRSDADSLVERSTDMIDANPDALGNGRLEGTERDNTETLQNGRQGGSYAADDAGITIGAGGPRPSDALASAARDEVEPEVEPVTIGARPAAPAQERTLELQ